MNIFWGIMIPFFGTSLGATFVFFTKKQLNEIFNRILLGIAAGIMVAASVWSLLIPAMQMAEPLGTFAFFPAAMGFLAGILFLLFLDVIIFRLKGRKEKGDGETGNVIKGLTLFVFAVILHNVPEGMAVGAAFSGILAENPSAFAGACALSTGIAIQNIPEGAIISLPLYGRGMKRFRAFLYGVLSGAVEPLGAFLTLILAEEIQQLLPFLLSFAAGSMMYVVVQELIPEVSDQRKPAAGVLSFSIGFLLMMILDVML